jgi:hypothetical protein
VICDRCRDAADGVDFGPVPVCSHCGQGPVCVYNDSKPVEKQSVVKHKTPGVEPGDSRYWCPGSKQPPRLSTGHDFCNGCACQHRPPGSWKGDKT